MVTLTIVRTVPEFESLRPEWTALLSASRSDCLFLTWEWLFTWWQHLGGHRRLSILTIRLEGRLVGIAPFALVRNAVAQMPPFRTLEFLGTGHVGSDYLDLIVAPGCEREVVAAVAAHVAGLGVVLSLGQLKAGGSIAAALGPAVERRAWSTTRTAVAVCPFIDLRSLDWTGYLAGRAASHRYNFGRRLRALGRLGVTTFETAATDAIRHESLDRLITRHLERWQQRGGSSAFHTPELLAFHEAFSRLALARGWLRLFTLRVGTAPVADLYCLRYGAVTSFYQSGFDDAWTRWSVGLVAMGLAIKASIEEGADEYDLLHGDEAYKFLWADRTRTLDRLEFYPAHVFGSLCRHTVEFKRAARRTARAIWSSFPNHHVQSPT